MHQRHGEAGLANVGTMEKAPIAIREITWFHDTNDGAKYLNLAGSVDSDICRILFFWRCTPDRDLSTQLISGIKIDKAQITIVC